MGAASSALLSICPQEGLEPEPLVMNLKDQTTPTTQRTPTRFPLTEMGSLDRHLHSNGHLHLHSLVYSRHQSHQHCPRQKLLLPLHHR